MNGCDTCRFCKAIEGTDKITCRKDLVKNYFHELSFQTDCKFWKRKLTKEEERERKKGTIWI